jgi:hypothetical protein
MSAGGGTSILTSFPQPAQTTLYNLGDIGRFDLPLVFLLLMAMVSSHKLGALIIQGKRSSLSLYRASSNCYADFVLLS